MIKIIKILTAMGNQKLNNILKEEKDFEIVANDIFYKEGILEFLEKNKNIDIIILYEKLIGEIETINLIKNIKKINNYIEIYFILENKNEKIENDLKKENIKNIFYNNKFIIEEFINKLKNTQKNNISENYFKLNNNKIIDNFELNNNKKTTNNVESGNNKIIIDDFELNNNYENNKNLEKEIIKLKNIIEEKNNELKKYKENNFNKNESKKIITVIGNEKVGKSLFIRNFKNISKKNINNMIDKYEFKEININNFYEIINADKITYKYICIIEINFEEIIKNKKIINKLVFENNIDYKKINIIFNKIDKYSINKKIARNIFNNFKILGRIKLNNYNDFYINEKNNYKKENKLLEKEYLTIIKKFEE